MNVETPMTFPAETNDFLTAHVTLMANSFERLLGRPLIEPTGNESMVGQLFHAPFVLLSHNTEAEPIFNYANAQALALFELSWDELIHLPSRLSAEAVNQEERARLLAQVTAHGFIDNYEGVRISKTGKRFKIRNAVVWNLVDDGGAYKGQAACFSDWQFL
jgi:hypothetical protein